MLLPPPLNVPPLRPVGDSSPLFLFSEEVLPPGCYSEDPSAPDEALSVVCDSLSRPFLAPDDFFLLGSAPAEETPLSPPAALFPRGCSAPAPPAPLSPDDLDCWWIFFLPEVSGVECINGDFACGE